MLSFLPSAIPPLRVLCLGAHCDDIEIGCGATLAQLQRMHPGVMQRWVVFCSTPRRAAEARRSAQSWLAPSAAELELFEFQDGYLSYTGANVKACFERIKTTFEPDLIFTHHHQDLHQDHRFVSELTLNTFRAHAILEYEIPKYDGGLGSPNAFVPLSRAEAARKAQQLVVAFPSQATKPWFTTDLFEGLMRLRGMECAAPEGRAEAFYSRKLTLAWR